MKRAFIILFFAYSSIASATTYYVSNNGDDKDDGLLPGTSWRTISKVNGRTFIPGDSILFKKGDVWRETLTIPSSGISENYIYFGYYGTSGAKPKILGSTQAIGWTIYSGNIWVSATSVSNPYAAVHAEIFFIETDGDITWGNPKKTNIVDLTQEYDWTWASNYLYVYAATDPDTRYTSIEAPQRDRIIFVNNKEYITIDGFELRFARNATIQTEFPQTGATGLIIKNCHLSHVGAKVTGEGYHLAVSRNNLLIQYNEVHDAGRRNSSVHMYGSSNITLSNITFEYNNFYDGYHSTGPGVIAFESNTSNNTFDNVIIRNNRVWQSPTKNWQADGVDPSGGILLTGGGSNNAHINNVQVYGNIIGYPDGIGMRIVHANNVDIYNNTFYDFAPLITSYTIPQIMIEDGSTNINIKNNIFYGSQDYHINNLTRAILIASDQPTSEVDVDYNLFYFTDELQGIVTAGGNTYRTTGYEPWSAIKTDLGWQTHDPGLADPNFVNAPDSLQIDSISPAWRKGVNVGLFFDRDSTFYWDPPSIGAYEYNPKKEPPITTKQVIILYPNPSRGYFSILRNGSALGAQSFRIINIAGKIVYKGFLKEGVRNTQFPINFSGGVYVVQVLSGNLTIAAQKLIVIR